jgi:hypothetical protein
MYRLITEAGIPLIPERLHDTKKRKEASRMSEYIYIDDRRRLIVV